MPLGMEKAQDYYRLLGVSRDATEREIKKMYYDLARRLHPDKAGSPEDAAKNASDLAIISQAYNTLKDRKKREEYDVRLRGRSVASPDNGSTQTPAPSTTAAPPPAPAPSPEAADPDADPSASPNTPAPVSGETSARPSPPVSRSFDVMAQRKAMAQKAFVRGMQMFKMHEYAQAIGFFEVAVSNDPEGEAQYHLKYAQCLMKTKSSFKKAVGSAEKACQMDPYNMEFKLVLAGIYETVGVLSKAKEIYEEILRWDPTHGQAEMKLSLLGAGPSKRAGLMDKLGGIFKKK